MKKSRYRDGANLSSDLKLLQDLEISVSKSCALGKKSRDATFERKRTDAVAKSIKREQARLKNIADESNPPKQHTFSNLTKLEKKETLKDQSENIMR